SVAISRHGDHRAVHSFPTRRSSYRPFGKTDAEEVRRDAQADVGCFAAHPPPPSARTAIDRPPRPPRSAGFRVLPPPLSLAPVPRSEEHTCELQSRENLVCRLLLEKK